MLLGAALLGVGFWRARLRDAQPDAKRFPVWGIDVSHHQGEIDWPRVAGEPQIAFAYIKATEGTDVSDPLFERNWQAARKAGLRVGAYHFYGFCSAAAGQAEHFLSVATDRMGVLPPALDLELEGNCSLRPHKDELRRELSTWLATVQQTFGQRALIYTTRETYDAYLRGDELGNPIWIRDLQNQPELSSAHWTLWQISERGRVAGIPTAVDLDVLNGDRATLDSLRARH